MVRMMDMLRISFPVANDCSPAAQERLCVKSPTEIFSLSWKWLISVRNRETNEFLGPYLLR